MKEIGKLWKNDGHIADVPQADSPIISSNIAKYQPAEGTWSNDYAIMDFANDDDFGSCWNCNQAVDAPWYLVTFEREKPFNMICLLYTSNDLLNRIRRERIVELVFEWNRFFDVRRWKVAEGNNDPDHWIYPEYHKGGEGGNVYGMNMDKDYPDFFARTLL